MKKNPHSTLAAGIPPGVTFPGFREPIANFDTVRELLQTRPLAVDIDLSTARSFAANTALKLPIAGNSFFIDQKPNSGYATCYVQDENSQGNTPITIYPGAVLRVPFTYLVFENVAQPGLSLRVVYGVDLDFVPALSAGLFGSISVINGELARTKAGIAFLASTAIGPIAGQSSFIQLWNPVANTKRLIVNDLYAVTGAVPSLISLLWANAAILTLVATNGNKLLGSAAPTAELRRETAVAPPGTQLGAFQVGVLQSFRFPFVEPIVIAPGFGLIALDNTANELLRVNFQWWEETI